MLAASVISRVYKITCDEELADFVRKLVDFTVGYQRGDGAFYYWAPPHKFDKKIMDRIDNYHTGFVLESLRTIKDDLLSMGMKALGGFFKRK